MTQSHSRSRLKGTFSSPVRQCSHMSSALSSRGLRGPWPRRSGWRAQVLVWMSSAEASRPLGDKLRIDAVGAQREAGRLPALQVRKRLVVERCISVFPVLRRYFVGRRVLLPQPTFGEYHRAFPDAATYPDDGRFSPGDVSPSGSAILI